MYEWWKPWSIDVYGGNIDAKSLLSLPFQKFSLVKAPRLPLPPACGWLPYPGAVNPTIWRFPSSQCHLELSGDGDQSAKKNTAIWQLQRPSGEQGRLLLFSHPLAISRCTSQGSDLPSLAFQTNTCRKCEHGLFQEDLLFHTYLRNPPLAVASTCAALSSTPKSA